MLEKGTNQHHEAASDLVIRPARRADLELVHALVGELAAYEKLGHDVTATRADLAAALFCAEPKVTCEIAEFGGQPAGLMIWFYTFSTFRGRHGIWLEDLYVRQAFRRKGIGKALIAALAARCDAEGLARLEWSVLDWNEPAIIFYETLGARLMSQWTMCRIEGDALVALAAGGRTRI
jgi:diamine N-acetyltransferase